MFRSYLLVLLCINTMFFPMKLNEDKAIPTQYNLDKPVQTDIEISKSHVLQELDYDIDKDGTLDKISLICPLDYQNKNKKNNINLVLKNGATGNVINSDDSDYIFSGYNPEMKICDLNNDSIDEILICTHDNHPFPHYNINILSFNNNGFKEVINFKNLNKNLSYTVTFMDNYCVNISNIEMKESWSFRLKNKIPYVGIYNDENKLSTAISGGYLKGYSNYEIKNYQNKNFIILTQDIVGLSPSNVIAKVKITYELTGNNPQIIDLDLETL